MGGEGWKESSGGDRRPEPAKRERADTRSFLHSSEEDHGEHSPDDHDDRVTDDEQRYHEGQAHKLRKEEQQVEKRGSDVLPVDLLCVHLSILS